MNVFVQCGLNRTLEYAYLATDNFKEEAYKNEGTKYYTPSILLDVGSPYTVIGVDMNGKKNAALRERHKTNPRIHIWDYALWDEDIESFTTHGEYAVIPEYMGPDEESDTAAISAITLNTLFSKISEIPGLYDLKIRCLHMNIESSEMNVLRGVDWKTFPYPDVIRVSTNHYHNADIDAESSKYCAKALQDHGYALRTDPRDRNEFSNYAINEFSTFHLKL